MAIFMCNLLGVGELQIAEVIKLHLNENDKKWGIKFRLLTINDLKDKARTVKN